jgi:hypothetical protein
VGGAKEPCECKSKGSCWVESRCCVGEAEERRATLCVGLSEELAGCSRFGGFNVEVAGLEPLTCTQI